MNLPHIVEIDKWNTPASRYPVIPDVSASVDGVRISTHRYRGMYHCWGVRGIDFVQFERSTRVTTLQENRAGKWHDWMVDDPPHWWAMEKYAEQSIGSVLTSGLGLGLYLHALEPYLNNLSRITVVERDPRVIKLIEPLLPVKVRDMTRIVCMDLYRFLHNALLDDYTTILIDIWTSNGAEEKMRLYWNEVVPMMAHIRMANQHAKLCFHGFHTVSDMRLWPEEFTPYCLSKGGQRDEVQHHPQ